MFKNYLRTTLRYLKKNRLFAAINIFGLSIALAVSFIMLLYVINELSYDTCHRHRKDVYRLVTRMEEFNVTMAGSPFVLATAIRDEFPQVEYATNTRNLQGFKFKLGSDFVPNNRAVASGSEVFEIFTVNLRHTLPRNELLQDPYSIVISESLSAVLFQGEEALGQEVAAVINNQEQTLLVTGVFKDIPMNSTFRADCFLHAEWTLEPINQTFETDDAESNWEFDYWNTWLRLKPGTDPSVIEPQLRDLEEKSLGELEKKHFLLQNLSDYYLGSEDIMNTWVKGSRKHIRMFILIGLLIIIIAAVNYITLATAQSTERAKEIALRKTAGAGRRIIRRQIMSESVMLVILVIPLSLLFMRLGLPLAGKLFQADLRFLGSNLVIYIPVYLLLTVVIGIASGLYSSSYLARLRVIDILENRRTSGKGKQGLRSALIVLQLMIFISFVSSTLMIRAQYRFALWLEPGYQNKNIVLVDLGMGFKEYEPYLDALMSSPMIEAAAGSMHNLPSLNSASMMIPHFQNSDLKVKVEGFSVDFGYPETMGISKAEGRYFSREFGGDLKGSCLINQAAVEQLGITDPIGENVGGRTVIGVVEDFNLHSIHTEIPPLIIWLTDRYIRQLAVRYVPGKLDVVLPFLEEEWNKLSPDRVFSYNLVEELNEMMYTAEKNLGTIVSISALFALLIACFGLFGLTLFVARTRTREIGIRKVFGSSESRIVSSFLKQNLVMVLIASVLSIPTTIYFISKWLDNFAYHAGLQWWAFLVAFLLAAAVVLLTVLFHSVRASRINPVEAIRYQ